jgi:glycine betaine/proline transport system substrate-binding protein
MYIEGRPQIRKASSVNFPLIIYTKAMGVKNRIVSILLTVALTLSSCAEVGEEFQVDLAYVNWSRARSATALYGAILSRLGYQVELHEVSNLQQWKDTAAGKYDATFSAWLPVTHADHLARYGDSLEDLGPNFAGTQLGFVVPSYVEVDTVSEMVRYGERFDFTIIGIDPGAGMSQTIIQAIEQNVSGMAAFTYTPSSEHIMVDRLGDAMTKGDWIVVPGWTPHWKFIQNDLKFLRDEEGIWGDRESIHTMVNKALKINKPELYGVLRDSRWAELEEHVSELVLQVQKKPDDLQLMAQDLVDQRWKDIQTSILP